MNFPKKSFAEWAIIVFLALFFILNFLGLFGFYNYGWDESVYIHMSNYIKSGGGAGLMESLRPTLFPLVLVPFSESIFASRLFVLMLSLATLWIFFLIGKKGLKSRHSWAFPVALAVFPYFLITGSAVMTEIPALFFHFLSVFFLLKKKHYFSGLFGVLAFLTRFSFGIYLPILFMVILFRERQKILRFILGMASGIPMLLINVYLFLGEAKNIFLAAIFPIINQLKDNTSSPYLWVYDKGFWFYPGYLFSWSVFTIFAVVGIIFLLRNLIKRQEKPYSENSWLVYLLIIPITYILASPHKEARYLMLVIPWVVYFMVYGIVWLMRDLEAGWLAKKQPLKKTVPIIFFVLVFLSILPSFVGVYTNQQPPEKEFYTDYLYALKGAGQEKTVLTATPMIMTSAKIIPAYDNNNIFFQKLETANYDYVYYSSAPFPCLETDQPCLSLRKDTKQFLDQNYALYKEGFYQGTDYFIYKSKG